MWLPLLPLPCETIKAKLCFADLPAELRNEIYSQALVKQEPIMLPYAYQTKSFGEPALLNVCRWIRAEATPVYYGCNIFEAPSPPSAHRFLQQLSADKIARIRKFRPYDLMGSASRRWYDALRTNINRLVEQCGKGELRSDAICVPVRDEGLKRNVWRKMNTVEDFVVVPGGKEGYWRLEWRED